MFWSGTGPTPFKLGDKNFNPFPSSLSEERYNFQVVSVFVSVSVCLMFLLYDMTSLSTLTQKIKQRKLVDLSLRSCHMLEISGMV